MHAHEPPSQNEEASSDDGASIGGVPLSSTVTGVTVSPDEHAATARTNDRLSFIQPLISAPIELGMRCDLAILDSSKRHVDFFDFTDALNEVTLARGETFPLEPDVFPM